MTPSERKLLEDLLKYARHYTTCAVFSWDALIANETLTVREKRCDCGWRKVEQRLLKALEKPCD